MHNTDFVIFFGLTIQLVMPRTYKPWIGNSLHKLLSYSEFSQNTGFHPRSHHLAIVQTRPSEPMLGFVDKFVMFVILLVRHMFFWVIIILHRRLKVGSVEIIV